MTIGIYAIVNLESMKAYIGQSIDVEKRLDIHIWELNKSKHKNGHLLNAWKKYGMENFAFIILEQCEQNELNELEIKWGGNIKLKVNGLWQQTYNIMDCGEMSQYSIKSSEKAQRTKQYYLWARLTQALLRLEFGIDSKMSDYNALYHLINRCESYKDTLILRLKKTTLSENEIYEIENKLLKINVELKKLRKILRKIIKLENIYES